MSHFSVGVIIDGKTLDEMVDKAVAKFEIAKETEATEEEISKARFYGITRLVEGALSPFYEELDVEPYLDTTRQEVEDKFNQVVNYDGEDEWYLKLKEKYKDFSLEDFATEFYGAGLTEEGIMSTYNPNSKWDWYVIGGRWAGCLKKKGEKASKESVSNYDDDKNSYTKIKDIEFVEEISEEKRKALKEKYAELIEKGSFYTAEYYKEKYPTYEDYEKDSITFTTYALLTSDGKWHEPGKMGWFGCNSAKPEDEARFKTNYNELIAKENPENYFVLVDCHI